jgi:hypothetical protein
MSIGYATGSGTSQCHLADKGNQSAGTYQLIASYIYDMIAVSTETYANIKSLDNDGFTITKAKSGSPTGTITIFYLAVR